MVVFVFVLDDLDSNAIRLHVSTLWKQLFLTVFSQLVEKIGCFDNLYIFS